MITYSLTAKLTDQNARTVGSETIKPMTIQNGLTNRKLEHKKINELHEVYNFFCWSNGWIRLVTYFERDWYYKDEDAYIVCEIDNSESEMVIHKVFVQLEQRLLVEAEGHSEVIRKQISGEEMELDLQPGKKMTRGNALRLKIRLSPDIKGNTDTTVEGELIKCSHTLSVTLSIGGCCQSAPFNNLPIRIYERPPAFVALPQFGGNFSPQHFAPLVFAPERSGSFENRASENYPSMN